METSSKGLQLIAAERARQVSEEGYGPEHDDRHTVGQIAMAAACYAASGAGMRIFVKRELLNEYRFVDPFPWDFDARPKPGKVSNEEAIAILVKAGALVAAEIDRLSRRVEREKVLSMAIGEIANRPRGSR